MIWALLSRRWMIFLRIQALCPVYRFGWRATTLKPRGCQRANQLSGGLAWRAACPAEHGFAGSFPRVLSYTKAELQTKEAYTWVEQTKP